TITSARQAERRLVECDLFLPADLVGEFLPGRCDIVGTGLGADAAGIDLRQFVLGSAVVLEDPGNAWFDRRIRVIVGVALRFQVRGDESLVMAGGDPLRNVEVALSIGLEARWIGSAPEREVLATEMGGRAPGGLLLDRIAVDPGHDVNTPADVGHVGRIVWS